VGSGSKQVTDGQNGGAGLDEAYCITQQKTYFEEAKRGGTGNPLKNSENHGREAKPGGRLKALTEKK